MSKRTKRERQGHGYQPKPKKERFQNGDWAYCPARNLRGRLDLPGTWSAQDGFSWTFRSPGHKCFFVPEKDLIPLAEWELVKATKGITDD